MPEFIKCRETLAELDAFYDGWIRRVGWALVTGYNHHGGRLPDRAVADMSPPTRMACRRIRSRCLVTAAADVLVCDQDFAAQRPAGNLHTGALRDIWHGAAWTAARAAHARGAYDDVELCGPCQEWHRP